MTCSITEKMEGENLEVRIFFFFFLFTWVMKNPTNFSPIFVLHLISVRVHSLFVLCQVLAIELWYTFNDCAYVKILFFWRLKMTM